MDRQPGHLTRDISNVASSLVWIKVVGIGDSGTGKTCLIKHFCESKFSSGYQPTVGVDYGFKIHSVSGIDLRVHLWDLSGQTDYIDVRNELYGNSDGVFMVFDVTNHASFESLELWLREFTKYGGQPSEVCLVANKVDLKTNRVVSTADAKKWAAQHKFQYYETSCATGDGVEKMFTDLLSAIVKNKKINLAKSVLES